MICLHNEGEDGMTISEQIKILCIREDISVAELARRLGTTPQSFNGKMKRESFTVIDMERIAEVTGTTFKREFILKNGETV
jgi:transcriptional regulator with XRE-family HTH domain